MQGSIGRCYKVCLLQVVLLLLSGCACVAKHQDVEVTRSATVLVSGLVKTPGRVVIPENGLTLGDVVAITGGENPLAFFKIPPVIVLVTLERAEGIYSFSLPLVTRDVAGKIYLQPDDRITIQPWYETDLSRLSKAQERENETDALGFEPTTRDQVVALLGLPKDAKKLRFKVVTSQFGTNTQTKVIEHTLTNVNPNLMSLGAVLNESAVGGAYPSEQTICVFKRHRYGRELQFFLLKDNPRYAASVEGADANAVLYSTFLAPADYVAVDILHRQPIILSSLVATQLYERESPKGKRHCIPKNEAGKPFPKVHQACEDGQNTARAVVAPVGQVVTGVRDVVRLPLQNVADTVRASVPR